MPLPRYTPAFLAVPFILGLLWTLSHPIISIVTGELKCRGKYLDEHQLEPRTYRTEKYPSSKPFFLLKSSLVNESLFDLANKTANYNLCDFLESHTTIISSFSPFASCHRHSSFDVVKILPIEAPTTPTESIVIVTPIKVPNITWMDSDVHAAILIFIHRLLTKPWLSKTILIVSPNYNNANKYPNYNITTVDLGDTTFRTISAGNTVQDFMDSYYYGQIYSTSTNPKSIKPLPLPYTSFIIRQLIVLDLHVNQKDDLVGDESTSSAKLSILPQGKDGTLPNLDLFFAAVETYGYSHNINVHTYDITWWTQNILDKYLGSLSSRQNEYAIDLLNMFGFMFQMILPPHLPHSRALQEGIDSFTLSVTFQKSIDARNIGPQDVIDENILNVMKSTEHLLRGLSNLHERLHHSVNQYFLPSPNKFVSHGEYIYPNILLLLPLVIKVIRLAFWEMDYFYFGRIVQLLLFPIFMYCIYFYSTTLSNPWQMNMYYLFYLIGFWIIGLGSAIDYAKDESTSNDSTDIILSNPLKEKSRKRKLQTIQVTACALAIYLHVPMFMGNASISFFSSILWVPLLAFPSYENKRQLHVNYYVRNVVIMLPLCFVWIQVMKLNISYVYLVFTPLYFLLSMLFLC